MPINRTSYDVQARCPGMLLTSGLFATNGVGAPAIFGADIGVTVARTGVGTFLVTIPSTGTLDFRGMNSNASSATISTNTIIASGNSFLIQTFRGTFPQPSPDSVVIPLEADAADGTNITDRMVLNFPEDGTITNVAYTPSALVAPAGGNGVTFSCGIGDSGVVTPLLGTTSVINPDTALAYNPVNIGLTPGLQLSVTAGQTLTFSTLKIVNGVQLPAGLVTAYWMPTSSSLSPAAPVDTTAIGIFFQAWIKNSSAR